jgi:predicted RNase H-like HicB family nuclease
VAGSEEVFDEMRISVAICCLSAGHKLLRFARAGYNDDCGDRLQFSSNADTGDKRPTGAITGVSVDAVKRYAVVIESGPNNLSAYVPDLPGCITTGKTVEEVERNIREAVELEGMREDGEPIPEPTTSVSYIELVA